MLQIKPRIIATPKASNIPFPTEIFPEIKDSTDSKPPKHMQQSKKKIVLTDKILSPSKSKSIYPIKSLSILRANKTNALKSLKKSKPLETSPSCYNTENNLIRKSNLNSSISPPSFLKNSPKHDSYIAGPKKDRISHLKSKPKIHLKQLNLVKDLENNQKFLNGDLKYKCKSCLENIIELEDMWLNDKCKGIEENFKRCSLIVRDFIGRMQEIGKSNEGVLLDKLWKHVVLNVDSIIDQFSKNNSVRNMSDSEITVKKISILENFDSFSFEDSGFIDDNDYEFKGKVESLRVKFDFLTEIIEKEWKQVNRKYLDSIVFRKDESITIKSRVRAKS